MLRACDVAPKMHQIRICYNMQFYDQQVSLALASMARDDPPASSTTSSTAVAMRGKVGSEFET